MTHRELWQAIDDVDCHWTKANHHARAIDALAELCDDEFKLTLLAHTEVVMNE